MSRIEWSTEQPKEAGFYWCRRGDTCGVWFFAIWGNGNACRLGSYMNADEPGSDLSGWEFRGPITPDDTAELVALLQLARNNMHKMFECEADERDVQVCLSRIDAAIAIRAPANTDSKDTKLSERKA